MSRLFSLLILSAIIAIPLAFLLGAASLAEPRLLELSGWLVCPAGTQAAVELIPQGDASNDYAIDLACVGDGMRLEDRADWAMWALSGLYWAGLTVLLFVGFLWFTSRPSKTMPTVDADILTRRGIDAEVAADLARGRKINAIKRVRDISGLGLKEAKAYVESLVKHPYAAEPLPAQQEAPPPTDDPVQRLQQLKAMLDEGLITADEYEAKKAEILGRL